MRRLLVLSTIGLLAAGCGSSGGGGNTNRGALGETAGLVGNKLTLILKDFTITPSSVTLPKPGTYTIEIHNEGAQLHNIAVEGHGVDKEGTAITFGKNESVSVTLDKTGEYEMYCPVDGHKALGMTGTITVAAGP